MNRNILALVVTVVIWGTTYVITKIALQDTGPFFLTFGRFFIALFILVPIAWKRGFQFRLAFTGEFLLFGLTGVAIFFGLQNLGLVYTSSANASMILASVPAVTSVLAVLILKECLHSMQWFGILCAVLGTLVVSLFSKEDTFSPAPLLGNLMLVGCVFAWALYTIHSRYLSKKYPPIILASVSIVSGLFYLTPLAAGELILSGLPQLSPLSILILFYLGLGASGLTFFLWNYALGNVPASVAAPYMNLIPVVGLATALLVGESMNFLQWLGGALALTGVWINNHFANISEPHPEITDG